MLLDELYDYKNKFMEDILTNKQIVHLINEEVHFDNAQEKLMYKQVFPFEYIPETTENGHTYVCCDIDIEKAESSTYLDAIIKVWVFSHKSRLRLPPEDNGGVRPDKICSAINKIINGSYMYGLGKLDLKSVRRFAPMTDYNGKCMTFVATEFNRLNSVNRKPIPANRKR